MLSTLVVSALLLLQTGFAVADSSGRKTILPPTHEPRHRFLVRQLTCPAGSFMCDDGTGCCDFGTTCGYKGNLPVCKGGSCNGGPICLTGLCCDLGYVCDEVAKLCQLGTSGGGASSSLPSVIVLSSTIQSPATSADVVTYTISSSSSTPSSSGDESSSSSFFGFSGSTSSSELGFATPTSGIDTTPTSGSGNSGSNFRPTSIQSTLTTTPITVPTGNSAADLSAKSGMKALAGVVAGALALVL